MCLELGTVRGAIAKHCDKQLVKTSNTDLKVEPEGTPRNFSRFLDMSEFSSTGRIFNESPRVIPEWGISRENGLKPRKLVLLGRANL